MYAPEVSGRAAVRRDRGEDDQCGRACGDGRGGRSSPSASWSVCRLRRGAVPLPSGLLDAEQRPSTIVADRFGTVLYEAESARPRGEWPRRRVDAAGPRGGDHRGRGRPLPVAFRRRSNRHRARGCFTTCGQARREGGSTITQQVAKMLLARQSGHSAHGWRAKLREAVVAIRLEHRLTKSDLLALYREPRAVRKSDSRRRPGGARLFRP